MKYPLPRLLLLGASLLGFSVPAKAAVVVTYAESPGAENSTLSNTQVFDFNNLSTGLHTNVSWGDVGSFNQLYIKGTDQYGGATDATHPNGSNYSVQGVGSTVSSTTLTLNQNSGYFGFWWSAGDASNVLDFYNNGNLVAEFTTANLLTALGPTYDGNPKNRSLDPSEPFAFINFYGDAQTTWNSIVFRNSSTSGFESDNYTSRVSTYNPTTDGPNLPGVTVARVDGKTTTTVPAGTTGAALWGSAAAVPGAPLPPLPIVVAFGAMALAKCRKGKGAAKGAAV